MRRSFLIPAVVAAALIGAGAVAVASPATARHAAPPPVSRVSTYADQRGVTLDWTDPGGQHFDHVVVRYRRGAIAPRHQHGHYLGHGVHVDGHASSATLHHLKHNTAYSVTIWAVSARGDRSASRHAHFTTGGGHVGRGHYVARFTDAAGHPLAGVMVAAEAFDAGDAVTTTVSGRDGRISLALPAGRYLVYASGSVATGGGSDATGYLPALRFTTVHAGRPSPARTIALAVGAALSVHVVDSTGQPVAGVTPAAAPVSPYVQTDSDSGFLFGEETDDSGRTDAHGDAILKGVAPFEAVQVCVEPSPGTDSSFLAECTSTSVLPRAGATRRSATITVTRHRRGGGVITGQVRNSAGRGFAGSAVELVRGHSFDGYTTTTRGGRFTLTGLRPGTYRLCAPGGTFTQLGRTGYQPGCATHPVTVASTTSTASASVVLRVGAAVTGTVTGPNGAPVRGADLEVGRGESGSETSTDPHGHFLAKGLSPGRVSACVDDSESFTSKSLPYGVRSTCGDNPFHPKKQQTFVVQRGRIRTGLDLHLRAGAAATGTVVDGRGRPVPYADVEFVLRKGNDFFGSDTSTDKHGHYDIAGQRAGTYRVCATPAFGLANLRGVDGVFSSIGSEGGCSSHQKAKLRTGHVRHHVRIVVPTTSAVLVTTHDQDGRPVAGVDATVIGACHRCDPGTTLFPKPHTRVLATATTGARGTVLLDGLKPGHYAVCLFAYYGTTRAGAPPTGYADRCSAGTYDIDVRAGHTATKTLVLRPAGAVSGRITDANGTPLVGVLVHVAGSAADDLPADDLEFGEDFDEADGLPGQFSVTAADGTYTVRSVAAGDRLVCADPTGAKGGSYDSGYLAQCVGGKVGSTDQGDPVTVQAGATTGGVDLTLAAGSAITGTITSHVRHPYTDVLLFRGSKLVTQTALRSGTYRFSSLKPGTYTVCAASFGPHGENGRCYDDVPWNIRTASGPPSGATPIMTTTGTTTTGIDIVVPR